VRNWDDDRRDADQLSDGVVGEVVFPNTVPPFYPGFVLFAGPPKPEDYAHRRAGLQAHNRWLVDFCSRRPASRAGVGQIFLNDIDDAIADATWIKEQGLRGGILLPTVAPDVKWVKPLYHPDYDRLWAALQDLDIPVNLHGGTGSPDYGRFAAVPMIMISEVGFYGLRPLVHMLLSGVFERFPRLKFVVTEAGAAAYPPLLKSLDGIIANVRRGEIGELKYTAENALPRSATEYFQQNVWAGVSFPGPADVDAARTTLAPGRFMWGSDYPHDEGTGPYTREHLRQVMHDVDEPEMRRILGENAAALYDFDLDALAPLADKYGPTVDELHQPLLRLPDKPNGALLKATGERVA
jgi:predicted TIM-barrel fold metal-dependent hydrolase